MLRGRILEDFYPSLVGESPMGLDPDVAAGFPARSTSSTRCAATLNPEILSSLPVCYSHWVNPELQGSQQLHRLHRSPTDRQLRGQGQ